jgi:hypothetical protein
MSIDILPESRATVARNVTRTPYGDYEPAHCANCGIPWGIAPVKGTPAAAHFLFVLCERCAETYGNIAHTYVEPDAVFYARLRDEMLERFGRELTAEELAIELESGKLQTLISDWTRFTSKGR